jgi:hypothetical protein
MKTTINKSATKKLKGEYSSIDEFVKSKLERATQTIKRVDLSKLPKFSQ